MVGRPGRLAVGGSQLPCTLDLPVGITDTLTLATTGATAAAATVSSALTAAGVDDVLTALLPSALLTLAGVPLTGFTVDFSPGGELPTSTSVTFGFATGDEWQLVPALNLTVSGLAFTATVVRATGYGTTGTLNSWGAQVSGQLTLGGATYAVTAAVPPAGGGSVLITDTSHTPALASVAGLTGLTADQVTGVLPAPLIALGTSFTLSQVSLVADPDAQALSQVAFTIEQTQPWPLIGGQLTLSGWSVDMTITKDGDEWTTAGVIGGSIELGPAGNTTAVNVTLPVPIGDDALWTLALADGDTVSIPSVGEIVALFGADPAVLPVGVSSFGGLTVTGFALSVNPSAASLEHLAFACSQASDWVIIGPDTLSVTGVAVALEFWPATSPVGVAGQITGILTLNGSPVDVLATKDDPTSGWLFNAAYEDFVHVPGIAGLAGWLDPGDTATALPATLPLANGLDVGQIFLAFDNATGALNSIAFSLFIDDAWTVVPGYLALTYVSADLAMPYPVVAASVTGTVTGVLTLAGGSATTLVRRRRDRPSLDIRS